MATLRAQLKDHSDKFERLRDWYHVKMQTIVEQAARDLMRRYPKFTSCCVGMGSFCLYNKYGEPLNRDDVNRFDRGMHVMLTKREQAALIRFEDDFMLEFNDRFDCTWSPAKWDGPDGVRVTDW